MKFRLSLLILGMGSLTACPSDDDSAKTRDLAVTLDAPEIIEIADDTMSITAHVTYADDGTPASGYTFRVKADCLDHAWCTVIVQPSEAKGTETFLIHPTLFSTGLLQGYATFENGGGANSLARFFVFSPSEGDVLQPAVTRTRLAIGERRPVAGIAHSSGGDSGAWVSAARPVYTVDDPAIATVDTDGVVTGVAAGTTTLHLAIGDATATVDIIVDSALVVGQPPEGVSELHGLSPMNNVKTITSGSDRSARGIAVDKRGYPYAIARLGTRALVIGWTGSGYGTELLPDGFDITETAYIAIDGLDRLYVITVGGFGLTRVYDRAASAIGPATWRRRVLDYHVAELDGAGAEWTSYRRAAHDSIVSVLPSAGDGIELAYRVMADLRPAEAEHDCAGIYRHAAITSNSIQTSDIAADIYDLVGGGRCGTESPNRQTFVLVRAADGTTQFVLPNGNRASGAPESYWVGNATYTRDGSGVWSTPPGTPNTSGGHFPTPSPSVSIDALDVPGAPSIVLEGLSANSNDRPFMFYDDGRRWNGLATLGPLVVTDAQGNIAVDNLAVPFWPMASSGGEPETWSVHGAAASDHRVHFLARGEALSQTFGILTAYLSRPTSVDRPEAEGRLAFGTGASGAVFAPDVVLADGTRVALASSGGAVHVQRSTGVDAPWAQLADTATLSPSSPLVESAGSLFAFDTSGVLHRSTDKGTTFVAATTATAEAFGSAEHLVVTAGAGVVFDVGSTIVYAKLNATAQTSPFASVTLPTLAPGGWSIEQGPLRRLLSDATGFTVLAQSTGGTSPAAIYVRRYSWSGALLLETSYGTADGVSFESLRLADGTVSASGHLIFMGTRNTGAGYVVRAHDLNLATGEWHAVPVGSELQSLPSNVLGLPDGRFVVAASSKDVGYDLVYRYRRAVYASTDWSAPIAPRPLGGSNEVVQRLMPNGSGGLTMLVNAEQYFLNSPPTTPFIQTMTVP